MVRFLKFL